MRSEIETAITTMGAANSMGDIMNRLRLAETKDEAAALRSAYLAIVHKDRGDEAESIVNANIGYMTGYYSAEEARRLLDLYDASHPIFGRAHANGTLTSEQAFNAGYKLGAEAGK